MPANTTIQLRKGSSSSWSSSNPVLASGEPGYDITNNILKIGDGITTWNDLPNHNHSASNITDFNSTVSGLFPVGSESYLSKFGVGGSGLSSSIIYDDGTNLGVGKNDPSTKLDVDGSIKTSGANIVGLDLTAGGQSPSIVLKGYTWFGKTDGSVGIGASHSPAGTFGSDADFYSFQGFNENVTAYTPICFAAGFSPQIYLHTNGNVGINTSNPTYNLDVNGNGSFSGTLYSNGTTVSVSGHTHEASEITDFGSSVSGLLPVTDIVAGTNITISNDGSVYTINSTGGGGGLTEEEVDDRVSNLLVAGTGIVLNYNDAGNALTISTSGNYSVVGHTHTASEITDFNSGVSGLVSGIYQPLLTNPVTGVGTSGYIPRWTSTSGVGNSIIFDNATNIGISTASPLQKLDVRGNVYASGNVGIGVSSPSGQLNVIGTGLFSSVTGISPNALLQTYSAISGATLFSADGTNGNLFTITDNLSGSLMSVNNIAGLPVFEVFSDDSIVAGRYNQNDFVINSSGNIGIGGAANNSYKLQAVGNVNINGTITNNGLSVTAASNLYLWSNFR